MRPGPHAHRDFGNRRAAQGPADGAVVVFEGIVRNHSAGRITLYLEYEAYEAMALAKMREIGAEMREKFSIRRYAMIHRLGRLEIGETAVLMAVVLGASRRGLRCLPLRHRYAEAHRAHLEERIFPGRRRLGRRRNPFRISNPFRPGRNLTILPMSSIPVDFPRKIRFPRAKRCFAFSWGVLSLALAGVLLWCASMALMPASAAQRDDPDERGASAPKSAWSACSPACWTRTAVRPWASRQDQFEVYEEGVKQKIEVFEPETQQPLDLTLMIDSSLSEIKDLEFEADAASRFIQKLVRPGDRLALFEFADAVTQIAPFSSNVPMLQAALKRIAPGDGTALYDAVYLGAQALGRTPGGRRRVIVLVTDAGETTSRADFETARRAALRADALLYTIRRARREKRKRPQHRRGACPGDDRRFHRGRHLFPDTIGELGAMFDRIDHELRTQYRLAYYPDPRPPAGDVPHIGSPRKVRL